MIVEVILAEVREHRPAETTTGHPPLLKGMGTHLHGHQSAAGAEGRRQLGLQLIGEGGGVGGGAAMAWPPVSQGAKQGGGPAGAVGKVFDQVGGGGFAVGAGNPDQGQLGTGLAPKGSGQAPSAFRHRIGHHQHRIPWARGI